MHIMAYNQSKLVVLTSRLVRLIVIISVFPRGVYSYESMPPKGAADVWWDNEWHCVSKSSSLLVHQHYFDNVVDNEMFNWEISYISLITNTANKYLTSTA